MIALSEMAQGASESGFNGFVSHGASSLALTFRAAGG